MSPRGRFSEVEITMIRNAICFFRLEKEKCRDKRYPVYKFVSECLGVSLASVKRVAAEFKDFLRKNSRERTITRLSLTCETEDSDDIEDEVEEQSFIIPNEVWIKLENSAENGDEEGLKGVQTKSTFDGVRIKKEEEEFDIEIRDPLEISNSPLQTSEEDVPESDVAVCNQKHKEILSVAKVKNLAENLGINCKNLESSNLCSDELPGKVKHFFCTVCSKGFASKYGLEIHNWVHIRGLKPFHCLICKKSFTRKSSLTRHTFLHTNKNERNCSSCGETFKHKDDLAVHMRIHCNKNKLRCEVCGKTFAQKHHLKEHISSHGDDNPFLCNICGMSFKHVKAFNQHQNCHSDTVPFCCNVCGKGFVIKSKLSKHQMRHCKIKPFSCNICSKSFTTYGVLQDHLKMHSDSPLLLSDEIKKENVLL